MQRDEGQVYSIQQLFIMAKDEVSKGQYQAASDICAKLISQLKEDQQEELDANRTAIIYAHHFLGLDYYTRYCTTFNPSDREIATQYFAAEKELGNIVGLYYIVKMLKIAQDRSEEKEKTNYEKAFRNALLDLGASIGMNPTLDLLSEDYQFELYQLFIDEARLKNNDDACVFFHYADKLIVILANKEERHFKEVFPRAHYARAQLVELFEKYYPKNQENAGSMIYDYFYAAVHGFHDAIQDLIKFFQKKPRTGHKERIVGNLIKIQNLYQQKQFYADETISNWEIFVSHLARYFAGLKVDSDEGKLPFEAHLQFVLAQSLVIQPYRNGKYDDLALQRAEQMLQALLSIDNALFKDTVILLQQKLNQNKETSNDKINEIPQVTVTLAPTKTNNNKKKKKRKKKKKNTQEKKPLVTTVSQNPATTFYVAPKPDVDIGKKEKKHEPKGVSGLNN